MSDLIYRKTAIDVIDKILPSDPMKNEYTQGITCGAALAMEYVKQLPSVHPDQKVGKWIVMDDDRISGRCSVCGWEAHLYEDDVVGMDYCPNCGAKMEEQDG